MPAVLTKEQDEAVRRCYDAGMTKAETGEELDIGPVAIRNRFREWDREKEEAALRDATLKPGDEGLRSFVESGNDAKLECVVAKKKDEVITKEDLIRVCRIDLSEWTIDQMEFKAYQTGMKLKTTTYDDAGNKKATHDEPHVVQLFSVSAKLKRVAPKAFCDAVKDFFAQFKEGVEPLPPAIHVLKGRRVMAEFDLCDVHFGKLAYHRESGQDYDLRIAERVFSNAVDDLIERARGREIEKIVVPFGNDYTHIDNGKNETTSGTPVDTDGRYPKVYQVALWSFYRAVERWRTIAPTELILVRGNHDFDTSMGLIHALDLKFHGDDAVKIDIEPAVRKYGLYGRTLTLYEHGMDLKPSEVRDLPGLMMKEAPKAWLAEAEFHEGHIGHYHSEKKFTTKDTDTGIGFVTRFMHSLSAADAWHIRKKFIGARRAAEVLFYDRELGFTGHDLALARS